MTRGNKKAISRKPGRPLGSKGQDSLAYQEFFVKRKFVVPAKELWCLQEAKGQYEFYKERVESGRFSPMEDNASKYLKIYQDLLKEIAARIYPKLKSIEQNFNNSDGESIGFKILIEDYTKKKEET